MFFSQLLYIFQSEHYDRSRFIKFVYSHLNWFSLSKRGTIDWTLRAKLIMIIALFLFTVKLFSILGRDYMFITNIILIGIEIFAFPVFIIIADIMLSPFVNYKKKKQLEKAKIILEDIRKKNKKFTAIGITGSYGKTTLKTILHSLLSEKYQVFLVPGNINTDLGIANYLIKNEAKLEQSNILLLEMGAFCRGEIKSICGFVRPEYSFLTAVENQHLERFGSHENIKKAKFELIEATTQKAFLNISNKNIKEYLEIFTKNNSHNFEIIEVEVENFEKNKKIKNVEYLPNFSGIQFLFAYKNEEVPIETKLIANHIVSSLAFCLEIAEDMQLSAKNIQDGIKKMNHVPHRLEVIKNKQTGVTVIDDSYNGNFSGFVSAIKTLERSIGRKVVLTPGMVELGSDTQKVHENVGELYAEYLKNSDVLLLIKNKNTQIIKNTLEKKSDITIIEYDTVEKAHADLPNILKKGDTILFQNDLSDNY